VTLRLDPSQIATRPDVGNVVLAYLIVLDVDESWFSRSELDGLRARASSTRASTPST
jgi:hypothetical protein